MKLGYAALYASVILSIFFAIDHSIAASPVKHDRSLRKITSALTEKLKSKSTIDVIVVLNNQIRLENLNLPENRILRLKTVFGTLRDNSIKTQKPLLDFLSAQKISHQKFFIINAIAAHQVTAEQIQSIAQFAEVEKVIPNFEAAIKEPVATQHIKVNGDNIPSNIKAIEADRVWNELKVRGSGIVVAGQDSGYDWQHPALKKSYRGYSNFLIQHDFNWHDAITKNNSDCGAHSANPCDDDGHGTHTMGTIVGDDGGANRIGVAPDAKWMGCRNMNKGVGTLESYLECFQFFLAPYPLNGNSFNDGNVAMAPHIINNSWSCPTSEGCKGEEFLEAVQNLQAAGIFVVVSAGNDGSDCGSVQNPPAFYSGKVFSIGAYDSEQKEIAYFSSRGPSKWNEGVGIDVVAPGVNIRSSVHKVAFGSSEKYDYKSGTSMAGPHVAGVVALLWSANPDLVGKVEKTWQLIHDTANPLVSEQTCGKFPGDKVPNAVFGHGMINAFKLVSQNMKK